MSFWASQWFWRWEHFTKSTTPMSPRTWSRSLPSWRSWTTKSLSSYSGSSLFADFYCLLLDIYSGGNLCDMIGSQEGFKLQEEIAMCLLAGLGYLHSKSIIHCNIKLENILLAFNGGGGCWTDLLEIVRCWWSADNNDEDVCSCNYKIQSLFKYKIQYFAQQVVAAPHPPLARSGLQCRCACQIKWWSWQCQWWWQWWWRQWWWWHWWWKQMWMIWMRTKKGPQDWIEAMFASSRI